MFLHHLVILLQVCKVPSSVWSRIGRLKRSMMPKLTKGTTLYGSGASPGIMSCIAGRLLCDTYLCSRDLLKEVCLFFFFWKVWYQIYICLSDMLFSFPFFVCRLVIHWLNYQEHSSIKIGRKLLPMTFLLSSNLQNHFFSLYVFLWLYSFMVCYRIVYFCNILVKY